jgi:hypothetical protein
MAHLAGAVMSAARMTWRKDCEGSYSSGFAYGVRETVARWGEPGGHYVAYFASKQLGVFPTLAKAKAACKVHSDESDRISAECRRWS